MGMRYLTVTKLPGATLSNQNVTDASQEKRRDAAVGMIGFPTGLVVDGRSFDRHCQDRSAVDGLSDQSDDGVSGIGSPAVNGFANAVSSRSWVAARCDRAFSLATMASSSAGPVIVSGSAAANATRDELSAGCFA